MELERMKCYVCYYKDGSVFEGFHKAFWYHKDAIAWVKADEPNRDYVEIEIE